MTWQAEYQRGSTDKLILSTNQVQLSYGPPQTKYKQAYFGCKGVLHYGIDLWGDAIAFFLLPGTEYQYTTEHQSERDQALFYSPLDTSTLW